MRVTSLEAVVRALNDAGVRFLIAGGVAVNAHGYLRFTADIDLVVALDPANVSAAFGAFGQLGYRPTIPVTGAQFADADTRKEWIEHKGMKVLGFFSDRHRETTIDVFVEMPFTFDDEYGKALVEEMAPGVPASFVALPTLIKMKESAARPRDQDDVHHLRWILEDQQDG
ncbi:MAG: hypothetical protein WD081_02415 [Gammaproteobacteria bacterium]